MRETAHPISRKQLRLILFTVGLGTLLSSLYNSVMNTILPFVDHALHISVSLSTWAVLSYLLVLSVLLLPVGRISDSLGQRPLLLLGFLLFGLATLWCGLANQFFILVIARALQAVAGAMILSVGPALLTTTFPPSERGKVLGLQATMTYLGLALGPFIGGWLTEWFGWHSVFWATSPLALVGLGLGFFCIPKTNRTSIRLDYQGSLYYGIAIISLIFLLNPAVVPQPRLYWVVGLSMVCLLSGILFIRKQRTIARPLIDLRLFRKRNFGFGTLGAILNYLCFFIALFLLPLYLSDQRHWTAGKIGLWMTVTPIVMMIAAPVAGALYDRIGSRLLSTLGMLANALSLFALALIPAQIHVLFTLLLLVSLLLGGLGTGLFAPPNNAAILQSAPAHQQGVASGTLATARYLGMMGGITIGGSLFDAIWHTIAKATSAPAAFELAATEIFIIGALAGAIGISCTLAMRK